MSLTENNDMDGLWVETVSKASTYTKKDFFFWEKCVFLYQNRTEGILQKSWNAQLIFL